MPRHILIGSLLMLGGALWLASLVVTSHPTYGVVVTLAVLVFAAIFVARPHPH
jgi:hypothetical protein